MKLPLIIIFAIVVLAVLGNIFFSQRKNSQPDVSPRTSVPPQPSSTGTLPMLIPLDPQTIPSGDKISFGTARGTVEVNNFYKIAQGWDGELLVIRQTPNYQLLYDTQASVFVIYVIGGPIDSSRKSAEGDLVNILGIPPAQVCYLDVSWSVSPYVDDALSGRTYPLSFCGSGL